MNPWLSAGTGIIALGVAFLLSGMEAGVFALSRLRIRRIARQGGHRAARLQAFLDHPENFLWTILIGNTLATFTVVTLAALEFRARLASSPGGFMVVMMGLLLVLYVFADLLPKILFRRFPNRLCLMGVPFFRLLHVVLAPAVGATEWISNGLLRWTGGRAFTGRLFGSRAELRQAIEESAQSLSREEIAMINRILDLRNLRVGDRMTPMAEATTLPAEGSVADLLDVVRARRVSSVPLWKGVGRERRIHGVVSVPLLIYEGNPEPSHPLQSLVIPALFVQTDDPLDAALRTMQRGRQRFAVVLDARRREVGVITLNDILGSMFGEVRV
ncbi:MAG: CNNM domain-containing protein [Limisphaerales bacterium]